MCFFDKLKTLFIKVDVNGIFFSLYVFYNFDFESSNYVCNLINGLFRSVESIRLNANRAWVCNIDSFIKWVGVQVNYSWVHPKSTQPGDDPTGPT